ncbi:MAG: Zn-ribbon domain-containing OB-fold protein [Anaerolineae bacterium]|nr:Zn-ribbon domain-containing OB-fold protein [Anaerolineae bacterium]
MQISQNWRTKAQRYALVGEQCPHCSHYIFPPRDVCPNCEAEAKTVHQFSGKGEIFSFTTITDAPAGFEEQAPYVLAIVKLDEGPMLTAQLTDFDSEPEIGMRVEMVTRKLKAEGPQGMIVYGYKFRPAVVRN